MPNSQFNSPATLHTDGSVDVSGTVVVAKPAQKVEFRFMIVQGDVVVEGTGSGEDPGWNGMAGPPAQGQLDAGPALAVGLAFLPRKEPGGGLGYETMTWSQEIHLELEATATSGAP